MPGNSKTRDMVKGDLEGQLGQNAKQVLKSDFQDDSQKDQTNLDIILMKLARQQFKRQFGYDWTDAAADCKPTGSDNPHDPRTVHGFCSITSLADSQVENYIENGILSGANLPSWMHGNTKADLVTLAKGILSETPGKDWRTSKYVQSYDANNKEMDSFKCSSVLVFVNTSLTEDAITESACILYFMGVYYKVTSPTAIARQTIVNKAYSSAPESPSNITSDPELDSVLKQYAAKKFAEQYKYAYDGNPPDITTETSSPYRGANKYLLYLQGLNNNLESLVKNELINGFNLTIDDVKSSAVADIISQCNSIERHENGGSWLTQYVKHTYTPNKALERPIRTDGVLLYFFDKKSTDSGDVRVTYIYYMAMFYEVTSPRTRVVREVFKVLCDNLRKHMSNPPSGDDQASLEKLVKQYALDQFKSQFKCDWDGYTTKPPNMKGTKVLPFNGLFCIPKYPPEESDVKTWVTDYIFPVDGNKFPETAISKKFYENTVKILLSSSSGSTSSNQDNMWSTEHSDPLASRVDASKDRIQEFAIYVHAVGEGSSGVDGGATYQQAFVYYLSVFFAVGADDWN